MIFNLLVTLCCILLYLDKTLEYLTEILPHCYYLLESVINHTEREDEVRLSINRLDESPWQTVHQTGQLEITKFVGS